MTRTGWPPGFGRIWRSVRLAWLYKRLEWTEEDREAYAREGCLSEAADREWRRQAEEFRCEIVQLENER